MLRKRYYCWGAMKELGDDSEKRNTRHWPTCYSEHHWKAVVLVGAEFSRVNHPYIYLETAAEAKKWLEQQAFENTYILVKGSRSVGMEKVLP